jgi:hypothetical protein
MYSLAASVLASPEALFTLIQGSPSPLRREKAAAPAKNDPLGFSKSAPQQRADLAKAKRTAKHIVRAVGA